MLKFEICWYSNIFQKMLKFEYFLKKCWNSKNVEIRKMLKFEKYWNNKETEKMKNEKTKKEKTKNEKETKKKTKDALPGPAQPTRGVVGAFKTADLVGV